MADSKTQYIIIFTIGFILLNFLQINFDDKIALTFFAIFAGAGIIFLFDLVGGDKVISYPFSRSPTNYKTIFQIIIPYTIFILVAFIINSTGAYLTQSVFQVFSAGKPLLANQKLLTLFIWGFLIPFVESIAFFGIYQEFLKDKIRLDISNPLTNFNAWILAIMLGSLFSLFHISVRYITGIGMDSFALLITFVFGVLSAMMVLHFKEVKQAVGVHVLINSIAMAKVLGYGFAFLSFGL